MEGFVSTSIIYSFSDDWSFLRPFGSPLRIPRVSHCGSLRRVTVTASGRVSGFRSVSAGMAFASVMHYVAALIKFQSINRLHVPSRSLPVLPLRLTGSSVLSWHPRASLPACSVLRPICCTGSPSFHVQIKCLVSTLLHSA